MMNTLVTKVNVRQFDTLQQVSDVKYENLITSPHMKFPPSAGPVVDTYSIRNLQ